MAGNDNHLLKLSEDALKIVDRQLTASQRWHFNWAIDVLRAEKDTWSRVFMTEAVDNSTLW